MNRRDCYSNWILVYFTMIKYGILVQELADKEILVSTLKNFKHIGFFLGFYSDPQLDHNLKLTGHLCGQVLYISV